MSSDCEERFLKYAPDGDVAKRIKEQREGEEENEEDKTNNQVVDEIPANTKNQSKSNDDKDDILDIDPDTHSTYLADYADISSIDWFGKSEIEIPEKFKDEN
jgi:hypothetical protein